MAGVLLTLTMVVSWRAVRIASKELDHSYVTKVLSAGVQVSSTMQIHISMQNALVTPVKLSHRCIVEHFLSSVGWLTHHSLRRRIWSLQNELFCGFLRGEPSTTSITHTHTTRARRRVATPLFTTSWERERLQWSLMLQEFGRHYGWLLIRLIELNIFGSFLALG